MGLSGKCCFQITFGIEIELAIKIIKNKFIFNYYNEVNYYNLLVYLTRK